MNRQEVRVEQAVGKRSRRMRRARDLTQAQLAILTGLNVITISRLENGTAKSVHGGTIVALARALGVSADYLLGLSEREEGGVPDTVTDTSHLRLMLDQDLRALEAGTVTDPTQIRLRLQQELRAFLDYAQAFVAQAEGVIDAIDTAEQGTGTLPDTITDSVTDTQSHPDEAAAVEPEPKLPRQSDDQSDDYEDRPRARRVAVPQDDELENMPLVPTAAAQTVKTARPKAAAKPKATAARQRAVTDTVPDTEAPQPQAPNAQRRKRLPVAY